MESMFEELRIYDIILIIGNYGAGKSRLANEYFKERKRIDRHVLRYTIKEMTGHGEKWRLEDWNEDIEGLIKHVEYDLICHFLDRNEKIIIDNTSLTKKGRARYVGYAKKYNKTIACVFLNRESSVLLQQNKEKQYPVPDHVIVQLFTRTEFPSDAEGFDKIIYA